MLKDIVNFILVFLFSFGFVFGSGWHIANEILPGNFSTGNFHFDGNVGIGTTSPSSKLTVVGTVLSTDFECTTCIDEGDIAQNQIDDSEIEDNSLTASSLASGALTSRDVYPTATDDGRIRMAQIGCSSGWDSSCDAENNGYIDRADDLVCTNCIGTTEIADSYVLNTGDRITGSLYLGPSGGYLYGASASQFTFRSADVDDAVFLLEDSSGDDVFKITTSSNGYNFGLGTRYGTILAHSYDSSTSLYIGAKYFSLNTNGNAYLNTNFVIRDTGFTKYYYHYDASGNRYSRLYHSNNGNTHLDSFGGGSIYLGWYGNANGVRVGNGASNWGAVYASAFSVQSDVRAKKNITILNNSLDKIMDLRGVNFYWKSKNKTKDRQVGLIAQEILEVFPEAVTIDDDENNSLFVNYPSLVAPLIEAVKELKQEKDNEIEKIRLQLEKQRQKIEIRDSQIKNLNEENAFFKQAFCEEFPSKNICQN